MESRFAPDDLDASKWENIEPFLDNLKQRKINSANCIEDLIRDESQLSEIISETRARTYINMTSQTDNQEYQKRQPGCLVDRVAQGVESLVAPLWMKVPALLSDHRLQTIRPHLPK